ERGARHRDGAPRLARDDRGRELLLTGALARAAGPGHLRVSSHASDGCNAHAGCGRTDRVAPRPAYRPSRWARWSGRALHSASLMKGRRVSPVTTIRSLVIFRLSASVASRMSSSRMKLVSRVTSLSVPTPSSTPFFSHHVKGCAL